MANCRDICYHSELCAHAYPNFHGAKTEDERPWNDCPFAFKIEDLLQEAEDIQRELEDEDELPFDDEDYDGPEVEEL